MSQQINLYNPALLTKRQHFSALNLLKTSAAVVLLGALVCAYWVWDLQRESEALTQTLGAQARELQSLQAAAKKSQVGAGAVDAGWALAQELQRLRADLQSREGLQTKLRQGLLLPGKGHAARMLLVAQSIPAQAWLTELKADETQLEISGFTLAPVALNGWIETMSASTLLAGQKITVLKVEKVAASKQVNTPASVPLWSFYLVSAQTNPVAPGWAKP